MAPDVPMLCTVEEACQELRISRTQLYRMIQRAEIRTLKIGRRRLIPRDALAEVVARAS